MKESVLVTRDSVTLGDDIDAPHTCVVRCSPNHTVGTVIERLRKQRYLPPIEGGKATWVLESTCPLAVIAQQERDPRFIFSPETRVFEETASQSPRHLHFRYMAQLDPAFV